MLKSVREAEIVPFGIGCYTAPEAARLLRTKPRTISRWLGGYTYRSRGETLRAEPLWTPQWPREGESIEIGFNDLIELRFVLAFLDKGVALNVIRRCQESARAIFADERPFSNHRFRTDGRRVFLETAREFADTSEGATSESLTDLTTKQLVFKDVVEPTFKDLDIADDAVVQWRPHGGKPSIVVDPARTFGKPVAAKYGIPTAALASAALAEGSVKRAARLFDVPAAIVSESVDFEHSLLAA